MSVDIEFVSEFIDEKHSELDPLLFLGLSPDFIFGVVFDW